MRLRLIAIGGFACLGVYYFLLQALQVPVWWCYTAALIFGWVVGDFFDDIRNELRTLRAAVKR